MNTGIKTYIVMRMAIAILIAALALAVVTSLPASAAPQDTVTSIARYTLLTANSITTTARGTGTGVRIPNFEYIDCYGVIDVESAQTVTLSFEGSNDGTNYAAVATMAAQTADTTIFTRTLVYGEYYRAKATVGTTNPVTVSVKCVAKN
jgi:hypothetical protein